MTEPTQNSEPENDPSVSETDTTSTDTAMPDSAESAESKESSREAFDDLVRSAKDAFKTGSRDAKSAAERAIPKMREGLGKGLHDLAYGLAYGLAFGATLAKEITPENLRDGFSSGSSAGTEGAESFMEKRRQTSARRQASVAPADDPVASHGEMRDDDNPGEPVFV